MKDARLMIRLTPDQKEWLAAWSAHNRRSMTREIQMMIDSAMDGHTVESFMKKKAETAR